MNGQSYDAFSQLGESAGNLKILIDQDIDTFNSGSDH